jgi:hypothetical protein
VAAWVAWSAQASPAATAADGHGTILVDGEKVFLIGLSAPPPLGGTTPWGTDSLDEVVAAGVNLVKAGPIRARWTLAQLAEARRWNEAAARRGIHTWVNLRELARAMPGSEEEALLAQVVSTLRGDAGLGFWKGADEPFFAGWPAPSLAHAFELTKSFDPDHLQVIIQAARGGAADLAPYSSVTNVHGVDVYPVRYVDAAPDLHRVGRWVRRIASVTPSHAVVATLQICFSGSDDPRGSGGYVLPTRKQERYMVYDAILNGARGLNFFNGAAPQCLGRRDAEAGWNWTFWRTVLRRLVLEVGPKSPLYRALLAPGAGLSLRVSDRRGMQVITRRVGFRDLWVVAARHGAGRAVVRFGGLPSWVTQGTVYQEQRRVAARGGAFADVFSRWAVHVYHFRG